MSLDPHLWQRLQAHGVRQEHLDMLVVVLELGRNGSFSFNYVNGQVEQADVRVVIPNRTREIERCAAVVSQVVPRGHKRA